MCVRMAGNIWCNVASVMVCMTVLTHMWLGGVLKDSSGHDLCPEIGVHGGTASDTRPV